MQTSSVQWPSSGTLGQSLTAPSGVPCRAMRVDVRSLASAWVRAGHPPSTKSGFLRLLLLPSLLLFVLLFIMAMSLRPL